MIVHNLVSDGFFGGLMVANDTDEWLLMVKQVVAVIYDG